MKRFLRKLTATSLVVGIAYGTYRLMMAIADEICRADEECDTKPAPIKPVKSKKKQPTKKKTTSKKRK